jgi:hypothetical protein
MNRTMLRRTDMEMISRALVTLAGQRASRTDRRTHLTATISLVGVGAFMAGVMVLHLLKRDLNPTQHFISEYALGDFGWIQRIDFLAVGVGTIALALTLGRVVKNPGRIAPIFIGLFGVSALLVAFVRIDGPQPITTEGQAHEMISAIGFVLLISGMFVIARKFRSDAAWSALRRPTIAWAATASATFIFMVVLGGIGQRIFIAACFSWMLAMAYHARNLARSA